MGSRYQNLAAAELDTLLYMVRRLDGPGAGLVNIGRHPRLQLERSFDRNLRLSEIRSTSSTTITLLHVGGFVFGSQMKFMYQLRQRQRLRLFYINL